MGDRSNVQERQFGELIRMWRRNNRQTQEQLAERSGLSVRSVAGLERGEVVRPRRRTVESLADALGLTGDPRAEFRRRAGLTVYGNKPIGARDVRSSVSCWPILNGK